MSVLRGVSTAGRHVLRAILYGVIGGLLVGIGVAVYMLDARPDLAVTGKSGTYLIWNDGPAKQTLPE